MLRKIIIISFLTLLIISITGGEAWANQEGGLGVPQEIGDKEEPIQVSAAGRVDYFLEEGLVLAQDNVLLIWGAYTLRAEKLLLDLNEKYIKASEDVYFSQGDNGFESSEIIFYFEEYKALILEPKGHLESEAVTGTIYIRSKSADVQKDLITIDSGKVSTCDQANPHYFFKAKRVDIFPGNKFTAHHISFWELSGYLPLFYWPRLTISLQDKEQRIVPEVGYSSTRGWYIKTSFNYLKDKSHGFYMLDFYSRTGLALGLKHFYLDNEQGTGYLRLYVQQDQANLGLADLETNWSHQQELGADWEVSGESAINYYKEKKITTNLQSTLKGKVDNLSINLEGKLNALRNLEEGESPWPSMDANLLTRLNYSLGRQRFYLDGKYNMLWNDSKEEMLKDWAGLFRYSGGATALTYQVNLEKRIPALGSTSKNFFYRLPEVNLKLRPGYFKFTGAQRLRPFFLDIVAGYYNEGISNHKGSKLGLSLNYSQTYRPLSWATINFDQRGSANYYSSGDKYYELYSRNRLTLQPLRSLRSDLTYTYRRPFQDTPFSFDSISAQEDLTGGLYFNQGPWSAQLSSGWNIKDEHYFDIVGEVRYSPSNKLDLRVSTGYSIQEEIWRDVILAGRTDYRNLQLTAGYRFALEPKYKAKNIEAQLAWQINPDIKLNLLTLYDYEREEISRGEAQLAWNFHCRELIFSYDHIKSEFWVQYHINAFPGQKLKLGLSSDEPAMIDIDLGDLLPW